MCRVITMLAGPNVADPIVRLLGVPANAEWTLDPDVCLLVTDMIHLHRPDAGPQCIGAYLGS